jgi:hypothetical protein
MITAIEYQEKICCELSRARTLHFAHIELQHKTTEQEVEFIDRTDCKLHELVNCFIQCLALEQSEQPVKKGMRRWWLDNKLDKIAVSGDL